MLRSSLFIFLAVSIPLVILYSQTLSPTVFWQDSGIFLSAVKLAGIAYPPGFPLYTILGIIFTKIFPFGDFVFKVHFLSAIFASAAAAIISIVIYLIIDQKKDKVWRLFIAIFSGFALGFSYNFWSQAINAEAYALHALFVAIIILFTTLILKNNNTKTQRYLIFGLFGSWGLSFANHPQTVFLAFPIGWIVFNKYWRQFNLRFWLQTSLILLLVAIIPYLYLPTRALTMPALNWGYPNSINRLIEHVSGKNYLASGQASFSLFDSERVLDIFKIITLEFFPIGLILALFGVYFLAKRKRDLTEFLVILLFTTIVAATIYKATVEYHLWLISASIVLAIFIGVALAQIAAKNFVVTLILIGLIIIPQIFFNWPQLNRPNYYYAYDFGKNILKPLDKNALIFISGDQEGATTMYLQYVAKYREDVTILMNIDYARIVLPAERAFLQQKFPDLKISDFKEVKTLDDVVNKLILANIENRSVYLLPKIIVDDLDPKLELIPAGYGWKAVKVNDKLQMTNYKLDLKYWDFSYHDPSYYLKKERKNFSIKLNPKDPLSKIKRISYIKYMTQSEAKAWQNLGDWYTDYNQAELAKEAYIKGEKLQVTINNY